MRVCEPNDSAFPSERPWELRDRQGHVQLVEHHWTGGLTKREYFAACALRDTLTRDGYVLTTKEIARRAIEMADALIDALNKEGE